MAAVLGILAGVLGGLFGIGGGILIVPVLVVLFGFPQTKAQGTSLVALLAPVGLFGLMEYYKKGAADLKIGGLIAVGFFLGAFLGSKVAVSLDPAIMRKSFACFITVVGVYMFFRK